MRSIPRILHFIWVGDEAKFPAACIETWRRNHPQYEIKVWGNGELMGLEWQNQRHIDQMLELKYPWCGVADLMRWEILGREGGIALDADSVSLKPLPEWLLECNIFAPWENEKERPGLVANGYVGARIGHPTILRMVKMFSEKKSLVKDFSWRKLRYKRIPPWKSTGPLPFTREVFKDCDATILPSHFFIPVHYSGVTYRGGGPVYACEFFGSTQKGVPDICIDGAPEELVAAAMVKVYG